MSDQIKITGDQIDTKNDEMHAAVKVALILHTLLFYVRSAGKKDANDEEIAAASKEAVADFLNLLAKKGFVVVKHEAPFA